jgi:hypothetical protein
MSSPTARPQSTPLVPGDGPRWIGDLAGRRARNRGWMRWWRAGAVLGVVGLAFLVAVFLVQDPANVLLAWFGCWMAAILAMVPAYRLGWAQRYDRYDDEMSRYAGGVRAEMSLRTGDGVVRLADRTVATSSSDAGGRRRVEVDEGTLRLEERIEERDSAGNVGVVALRLVDEADVVGPSPPGPSGSSAVSGGWSCCRRSASAEGRSTERTAARDFR